MSLKRVKKLTPLQEKIAKETERLKIEALRGLPGQDGVDGKPGNDGVDGEKGRDGIDGQEGVSIKGDQGNSGIDGQNGRDGIDGQDGEDGENGKNGRGIERVQIINGYLWVFYDDGTKQNAGRVNQQMPPARSVIVGPGTGTGGTWAPIEVFILTAPDISNGFVELQSTPKSNSEFVFVNGLEEDCYTLTGNKLDFTALGLLVGEKLTVKYQA